MLGQYLKQLASWLSRVVTQPRQELNRWQKAARFAYDLARYGGHQLREDRAPQIAAALAFRTLFALVPVLIVAMIVVKAMRGTEDFFQLTQQVFAAVNLDQVQFVPPDQVSQQAQQAITLADWLQGLVRQAAEVNLRAVNWLGMALICYAALGLMTTIENAFNTICRAKQARHWIQRVPLYWFVLTMSPVAVGLLLFVSVRVNNWIAGHLWVSLAGTLWSVAVSGVVLFAIYSMLPNTRVGLRPAAIGALVAAILLEFGKQSLGVYVENAFTVSQLYGSLGLIPLFMFWVYLMWLAVLFGLEVTATLEALHGRELEEMGTRPVATGLLDPTAILAVMAVVAERFTEGRSTPAQAAAAACDLPEPVVQLMFQRLVRRELLHLVDGDTDSVTMALPAEKLNAAQLIDIGYELTDEPSSQRQQAFTTRLRAAQQQLARQTTLAALVAGE